MNILWENTTPFLELPRDILVEITTKYLSNVEALCFRCVCLRLRALVPAVRVTACKHLLYMHSAAKGHLSRLEWLHSHQRIALPLCRAANAAPAMCSEAARNGHLAVLQWMAARGVRLLDKNNTLAVEAAHGGHLSVLQWLRSQGIGLTATTFAEAARSGNLELLRWLLDQGCPHDSTLCAQAARGGHLEVLKWAREHGCQWDSRTCARAAGAGNLQLLVWLRQQVCMLLCGRKSTNTSELSSQMNTSTLIGLEVLKLLNHIHGGVMLIIQIYLHTLPQACEWSTESCSQAARWGHLEVLCWLRAEQCPWASTTCLAAAKGAHLAVLKWAHMNGCALDAETLTFAAEGERSFAHLRA